MDWLIPKDPLSQVTIRPFERDDQSAARQLILNGLAEHWGWLDPGKNQDLDDIGNCYSKGTFLVAVDRGEIVGTGGLITGARGSMEIVRMHVAEHYRRMGIGRLLVTALCEKARALGAKSVLLETTATWEDAISFYTHMGFETTHYLNGDVYMVKKLDPERHVLGET